MHKRTRLTVTEPPGSHSPKRRRNRRRRNWNALLRRAALGLALVEAALLLFANPYLHVTKVHVDGTQTLTAPQVFEEAQVPAHANIFGMLRQPFARRLSADPVIDHAARSIRFPDTLVLTVTERQPKAVLAANGQFWLVDAKSVAYRQLAAPPPGIPVVTAAPALLPPDIAPGRSLRSMWLSEAFSLLDLQAARPNLAGLKITVDQNSNLCLNRQDNLQIRLGQSDSLPQKLALASVALAVHGRDSAYIDVSSPEQMVRMPRKDSADRDQGREQDRENNGPQSRTD